HETSSQRNLGKLRRVGTASASRLAQDAFKEQEKRPRQSGPFQLARFPAEKAPRSVRLQTLQQVLNAFANFLVGEGVALDDVFADRAVGQAIDGLVHQVKDDGALAILDGAQVIAGRTVEAVPAAVVAADKSGGIDRRGHTFAARLDGELIAHQEIG